MINELKLKIGDYINFRLIESRDDTRCVGCIVGYDAIQNEWQITTGGQKIQCIKNDHNIWHYGIDSKSIDELDYNILEWLHLTNVRMTQSYHIIHNNVAWSGVLLDNGYKWVQSFITPFGKRLNNLEVAIVDPDDKFLIITIWDQNRWLNHMSTNKSPVFKTQNRDDITNNFIRDVMSRLTNENRLEIMSNFCKYCGDDLPTSECQCWNDN